VTKNGSLGHKSVAEVLSDNDAYYQHVLCGHWMFCAYDTTVSICHQSCNNGYALLTNIFNAISIVLYSNKYILCQVMTAKQANIQQPLPNKSFPNKHVSMATMRNALS
jgi:hypothetical protein